MLQRAVLSLEIGDCKSAYMGMLIAEQIEHEELSPLLEGQPVRISSMVLLLAYAFYHKNVFSIVIYHHMPRERRCLRHPGAQP